MCSEGGCRNSSISSTHVSLRRKNVPKPLTQLGYCTTCAREEGTDLLTTISTLAVRGIITSSGIANRMYVLYVNVVGSESGAHSGAALQAGPRADRSQPPPPLICTTWSVALLALPPPLSFYSSLAVLGSFGVVSSGRFRRVLIVTQDTTQSFTNLRMEGL